MAERKLIDLETLKRYHGKSLAEIYKILEEKEEIKISDTEPTNSGAKLWIDTAGESEISVPEIKDDATSTTDTWSSAKITSTMASTVSASIDEKLSQNIADTSDVDSLFEEVKV